MRGIIRRWRKAVVNLAVVSAILVLASFVPPDASLSEIRKRGIMRVCAPPAAVSTEELSLLRQVAQRIGVGLQLDYLPAMAGDANPRNWRISRAQCDLIAGGLVDNAVARSFLTVVPNGIETGWATWPRPLQECPHVVVYAGTSGLDRIALSRGLRDAGITVVLGRDAAMMLHMAEQTSSCALSEAGVLRGAMAGDGPIHPVRFDGVGADGASGLGFGLWKGDATFARAVRNALD